ncbi:efflux ABC transporter, permease protein [[Eubacterium] yurii subsp. margaretiae ATCC 43715]|nr:efflux ABC transporter, permease protein [[Eubacterium] yurii subsp. margaretiae ATCC 43715]
MNKKLLRDLLENKGANLAAIVVVSIAIMLFVGASISLNTLIDSRDTAYEINNFPDVYAKLISISDKKISSLQNIDKIKSFEPRLVEELKIANTNKTIRMMSITYNIGKYVLVEGSAPRENAFEILIDEKFAEANNYKIGQDITVISNGVKKNMKICGTMFTAEGIYSIRDNSTIMPNYSIFSLGFTDIASLQRLTGKNYYNEILFDLKDNVEFEDVKNDIKREIENYGLINLYPQDDQISDTMIDGEIDEQRSLMIVMPIIFLSVAILVMGIMVKRIIEQQRMQIGILKSFGYSDFQVGFHYASYCLVIGLIGGIIGCVCGVGFGHIMLSAYKMFFNMEFINNHSQTQLFAMGIALSSVFSVAAGINAATKAVKIMPSEAMRQEAPKSGKKMFLEALPVFNLIFNSRGKMSVRNISRNKKRSFFIILGIALGFAISVLPWSLLDLMDKMIFDRYRYTEKYDIKIFLNGFTSKPGGENALNSMSKIQYKQGILEVPVTVEYQGVKEDTVAIGLQQDSRLYTVVDDDKNKVDIPSGMIVLSEKLAEKLNTNVGDYVSIKSPYSKYKEDKHYIKVGKIVKQSIGMNGYLDITYLSNILGYEDMCNSILLKVEDENYIHDLREKFQDLEKIVSIQSKVENMAQIRQRMETMYSMIYFMAIIAAAMTFAIVYNTFVVVLLERQREISTLMVLGMKEKEVLSIISLEQNITSIIGVILGLPIGKLFIIIMAKTIITDTFTMPTDMSLNSVLIALVLLVISVVSAQLLASRKLNKIEIVDVLKSGE